MSEPPMTPPEPPHSAPKPAATVPRRRAPGIEWRWIALPVAIVLLALGWYLKGKLTSDRGLQPEQALRERTLPGLRVSLPEWQVTHEVLQPGAGALVLAAPGSDMHEIKLTWVITEPMSRDEMVATMVGVSGRASLKEAIPVQVAGSPTEILMFDLDGAGKLLLTTHWRCPADPRGFVLYTFHFASRDDLVALHRRMLDSVRCEEPPSLESMTMLPVLDGEGLARTEQAGGVVYTTAEGEEILFSTGIADRGAAEGIGKALEVRIQLLRAFAIEPDPGSFGTSRPYGDENRPVWRGTGTDTTSGARVHVLLTVWPCPVIGQAFLGLHVAEAPPRDEVATLLASARCPS